MAVSGISPALAPRPDRESELVHQLLAVDRSRCVEEVGLDVGEIVIEHRFALVLHGVGQKQVSVQRTVPSDPIHARPIAATTSWPLGPQVVVIGGGVAIKRRQPPTPRTRRASGRAEPSAMPSSSRRG